MAKINIYNQEGKTIEEIALDDAVFGLPKNDDLVHQVYVALSANARQTLAHTKTRGDRAGSGIKPWRQKGTGRARVGSVRTPVWRKGGVVFGPRSDRNYSQKIGKKMNAKAIMTVLSGKLKDKEIAVIDTLKLADQKTKSMARVLKNMKLSGSILLAFSKEEQDMRRNSRNLPEVKNILADQLNVRDMLDTKNILFSKESIQQIEKKYKKEK